MRPEVAGMRAALLWAGADIRRRWASLVVLAVIVGVAVGPVLALVAGADRADDALDRYLAAADVPEVLVSSQAGPTSELLASLASDPRISRVERGEGAFIAPAPMEPGGDGFTVIGIGDSLTGGFGRPLLVSGRYPAAASADEIVVNEGAAASHGLRTGQRVPLLAIACIDGCPPEPVGEATIVGVVRLATDLVGDPSVAGVAFADPALLAGRWRASARLPTWLGVHLHDDEDTAPVIADLSVEVVDGEVASSRAASAVSEQTGRRQRDALRVTAAVVAVLGALVVAQAMARHLAVRWADASVLAAVGLTRRERAAAAALAAPPALAAGLAGAVAIAAAMSPLFPLGMTRRADPDVGFHANTATLVAGGAVAVGVLIGVVVLVARHWATPPRVAATAPTPSIAARLSAALGLGPVAATGSQFALDRGRGASRLPVVATLATVIGVTAVVVGALVVRWSLDGLVAAPARYGQAWELQVAFAATDLDDGAGRLADDPRVHDVATSRTGELTLSARDGTPVQVPTTGIRSLAGALPVAVLDGRVPAGPHEIALSINVLRTLGLGIGDRTTAKGPCGTFEAEVVGRVIVPITGGNYPDDGSLVTLDAFDELCAQDLLADVDASHTALVRLREPAMAPVVRDEWRARGLQVTDRPTPTSINSLRDIRTVPAVAAAVAGLLGTATIAHALLLAVRRRQRDIAVLRALGLRPAQAGSIVRWQSALHALVAIVVGLPFGLVLGRLVWTGLAQRSNVVIHIDVSILGLAGVATAALVVAALVAIWPSRRAARLQPAATLRSE